MFKARSGEPDRDFCLDYTNIHSFVEVLRKDYPREKEKNWLKNRRAQRRSENMSQALLCVQHVEREHGQIQKPD